MQRANVKRVRTSISLSSIYLLVRDEAEMLKKVAFTLLATALPSIVLPGGPNSSMPLAGALQPCTKSQACRHPLPLCDSNHGYDVCLLISTT